MTEEECIELFKGAKCTYQGGYDRIIKIFPVGPGTGHIDIMETYEKHRNKNFKILKIDISGTKLERLLKEFSK